MAFNKVLRRRKIRYKIRNKIIGSAERPRLSVFRSNSYIYAQVIDDSSGHTLATASSKEQGFDTSGSRVDQSKAVGKLIAERAQAKGVSTVVFDRGGYLYHGRIKSLGDAAREQGLQF